MRLNILHSLRTHTNPCLQLCGRVYALVVPSFPSVPSSAGGRFAKVHPQTPAVDILVLKNLLCLSSAGHIDEVGVGETSGLASPPINGDTDVHYVANVTEQIVQVLVGHLKRHVSDEERLGWWVGSEAAVAHVTVTPWGVFLGTVKLDYKIAALEDLHIQVVDSCLGIIDVLELNITEPASQ